MDLIDLIVPSGVAYVLFVTGLASRFWRHTRDLSWWILASSGTVTLLCSSGLVAAAITGTLEYSQPALREPAAFAQARHIVVLTGWASNDQDMPLTARLNASSAYRVLLALELFDARPDCRVIVSGSETAARIMAEALGTLGVPRTMLLVDASSESTAASAEHLKSLVSDEPFFLVTSAGHMPRALQAMRHESLNAIPAPTDHQLPRDWRRAGWEPRPEALAAADRAVHEWQALVWYRLWN